MRTAIKPADRQGLDALSMRKLATGLKVEAMSLYKHVANKDELLDGMVDQVIGEITLPTPRRRLKDRTARAPSLRWR